MPAVRAAQPRQLWWAHLQPLLVDLQYLATCSKWVASQCICLDLLPCSCSCSVARACCMTATRVRQGAREFTTACEDSTPPSPLAP